MGELTDAIFLILGKTGKILNINGKRACFILWILCVLYWLARNYQLGLKAQFTSALISLCMHVWGFLKWKRLGR